jgi:YD repeat-containing protein
VGPCTSPLASGEGDLLARHDSERGVTRHAHAAAHRLAATAHPDGRSDTYKIDLAGNVLEAPGLVAAVTAANTLRSANGSAFEYNQRDHIARRHAPQGTFEYCYDSRDQLKAIDGPAVAYRAQHGVLGRRTEKELRRACSLSCRAPRPLGAHAS